jgi:DNA replication protein DnaC
MTSAVLDRITHHSHYIKMKGESYRQLEENPDVTKSSYLLFEGSEL